MPPPASIVIPTRARLPYLEVALASIAPAGRARGRGGARGRRRRRPRRAARALAERFGARYEPHPRPLGLNVARNTGVERSTRRAGGVRRRRRPRQRRAGCAALLDARPRQHPQVDVFTGPITRALEGPAPRTLRARAPADHDARPGRARHRRAATRGARTWRSAAPRWSASGPFDVSLEHGGDEQEWQERLRAREPAARVLLRRRARRSSTAAPAPTRACARSPAAPTPAAAPRAASTPAAGSRALARARAEDARRLPRARRAPPLPGGADDGRPQRGPPARGARAHARGAAQPAPRRAAQPPRDDFLSRHERHRRRPRRHAPRSRATRRSTRWEMLSGRRLRLALAARRRAAAAARAGARRRAPRAPRARARRSRAELLRSRHDVELHTARPDGRGKFENLNRCSPRTRPTGHDWLLVVDDDVELPRGFLDRFLFLCERFSLALAQPAHRLRSHAAWPVTRRRRGQRRARDRASSRSGP